MKKWNMFCVILTVLAMLITTVSLLLFGLGLITLSYTTTLFWGVMTLVAFAESAYESLERYRKSVQLN